MTAPLTITYDTTAASANPPKLTTRINWLARHLPDPVEQREYARDRVVVAVTEQIWSAIEAAGLTKADVAARLGKHRSYVTRALNGAQNMTLHTWADLLWACERELLPLADMDGPLGVVEVAPEDARGWEAVDFHPMGMGESSSGAGTRHLILLVGNGT